MPSFRQLFLAGPDGVHEGLDLERRAYVARKRIEHEIADGDDTVYGRGGGDTIAGDAGEDQVFGGAGDDIVDGGADGDGVYGDDGNDTVRGGAGNDVGYGGVGSDFVDGEGGDDTVYGGSTIFNAAGNDTLGGDIVHGHLVGTRDADTLDFRYVQLKQDGTTSSGHCVSAVTELPDGRVRLDETWEWESLRGSGTSVVEELTG